MRRKNIFMTILVLATFVLSLTLAIGTYIAKGSITGDKGNEIVYEDIENPLMDIGSTSMYWPTISTDRLADSIVSMDGDIDQNIFEEKFEEDFYYKQSIIDDDKFTFEYELIDDRMEVTVDSNIRMYNNSIISNPTHTYTYVLNIDE